MFNIIDQSIEQNISSLQGHISPDSGNESYRFPEQDVK
jgi:hypothetical protein